MDATNNSKSNTVILPCGDVGTAGPVIGGRVNVVHHDRTLGRGPWNFAAEQVIPATAEQDAAYQARCDATSTAYAWV